jgi:hypothetical protein
MEKRRKQIGLIFLEQSAFNLARRILTVANRDVFSDFIAVHLNFSPQNDIIMRGFFTIAQNSIDGMKEFVRLKLYGKICQISVIHHMGCGIESL